jgi:hypothetical protein
MNGYSPITVTPTVELGVVGSRGDDGMLLRAPMVETLLWDIDSEITSARRAWSDDLGGWWIDVSYLQTVLQITLRSFPSVMVLNGPDGDRVYSRDGTTAVQERLL